MELYISWVKGLPYDKKALSLLKHENLGIEMREFDEQIILVKDAGVRRSCHNPAREFNKCLHDTDFMDIFQDARVLEAINSADADVVSFHNFTLDKDPGYKNSPMFRLKMIKLTMFNLEVMQYYTKKRIIFESPPFSVKDYPSHHLVSEPDYIRTLLILPKIGYLFDVAHNYVSAHNKKEIGTYKGSIDDYFDDMLNKTKGKTRAMHLNVPYTNADWFTDEHLPFMYGNGENEYLLELTQKVIDANPVSAITLEMTTGLDSYNHASFMANQAEYLRKKLNL